MQHRMRTNQDIVADQERMLRLAERDYGLTLKVLELETGIPIVTLRTYKRGTMMPLSNFVALARVIPDELTSLCFAGTGKVIATPEPGEGDLDELAEEAAEYVVEYTKARSPRSPGGAQVIPMERENLKDHSRRIADIARRAAGA